MSALVAITLASAASPLLAQDGGVPCGNLTYIGECSGDTVRYCGGTYGLIEFDCSDSSNGFGPDATCGLLDCTDEAAGCEGYYCVARPGRPCDWNTLWCDVEQNQGCLGGVCAPSQTCDAQSYVNSCSGPTVSFCFDPVVWDLDCSGGGLDPYTCGSASTGTSVCLGLAGGGCDPTEGYECAAGLSCDNFVCTAADGGVADSSRPDSARPDMAGPDRYSGSDAARPDTARSDSARPDTSSGYDSALPDRGLGSDAARTDSPRPDILSGSDGSQGPPPSPRDSGDDAASDYVATAGCACGAMGAPAVSAAVAAALLWRLASRRRRRG